MNAKGTYGPSVPFLESEEEQPAHAKALRRGQHRKIRVRRRHRSHQAAGDTRAVGGSGGQGIPLHRSA